MEGQEFQAPFPTNSTHLRLSVLKDGGDCYCSSETEEPGKPGIAACGSFCSDGNPCGDSDDTLASVYSTSSCNPSSMGAEEAPVLERE